MTELANVDMVVNARRSSHTEKRFVMACELTSARSVVGKAWFQSQQKAQMLIRRSKVTCR
jgi:hypothetical protein